MSIQKSEGYKPSPKTDLEELIYSLVYLFKNTLPWSHVKGKTHPDTCRKICSIKKNIEINVLFKDLLEEFIYIYKNILKLDNNELPEY